MQEGFPKTQVPEETSAFLSFGLGLGTTACQEIYAYVFQSLFLPVLLALCSSYRKPNVLQKGAHGRPRDIMF